ncbi:MAG: molybdate ABC transporter substrate-binding protein [Aquificae bacterium]|nr:molybdate ABC transporter substrate-binding protein [Aquificota bacterium]
MVKIFLAFLLFFSFSFGKTLLIAAAANTQFAVNEIKKAFEKKYPEIHVKTVISSSGKLAAQILKGAPYDIFISADMKYPLFLYKNNKTVGKPKVYAYGTLVLWTTKNIKIENIKQLKEPFIKKVAVANPKTAPYGRESINVLKHYKIYKDVKNKLVFGESISQTSQYIHRGLVDIGFTAKSIVLAPKMKNKGHWIEIDKKTYEPIKQGAVILKNTKNLETSKKFFEFLFSKEAKDILKKYGYTLPKDE